MRQSSPDPDSILFQEAMRLCESVELRMAEDGAETLALVLDRRHDCRPAARDAKFMGYWTHPIDIALIVSEIDTLAVATG